MNSLKPIFPGKFLTLAVLLLSLVFTGCAEKKKEEVIIVKSQNKAAAKAKKKTTIAMETLTKSIDVEWGDGKYAVEITREADTSLPVVKDAANDEKYYDNSVSLRVLREDGTEAVSKTYRKADFKQNVASQFYDSYVLLALLYDRVEAGRLRFIVSIGEPDPYSDNYTNLLLTLSKSGDVTLAPYVIDERTGEEI